MMKIRDLDDFVEDLPRLPIVLTTHDIVYEDWQRLMTDIALAWQNSLPLPNFPRGVTPKPSSVIVDLLDLWNAAYFLPRGVELVMYKGRERRSGRGAGRPEMRLPRIDDTDSDDSSSSEDSYSEPDGGEDGGSKYRQYGVYGGRNFEGQDRWAADRREARQYRQQRKEEKSRRKKEKKMMRRKDKNKKHTLYMTYVPPRDYSLT